jgi:hypothetical protein
MCGRVVRVLLIVGCIIGILYCDTVQYQGLLFPLLFVQNGLQICDKTVVGKLNPVIFCEHYSTVAFDIRFITDYHRC